MEAADTFFLNVNAPRWFPFTANCAHTLIFRLELNIVEFEPRILHNTVPIAVCTVLRHKGIKNIASIGCCIIKLIRVLITIPLYMFRKLVNSRLSKDFIVRSWMEASEKAFSPLSQLRLDSLINLLIRCLYVMCISRWKQWLYSHCLYHLKLPSNGPTHLTFLCNSSHWEYKLSCRYARWSKSQNTRSNKQRSHNST